MFDQFDANKDEKITIEEVIKSSEKDGKLTSIISKFDRNQDGYLTLGEVENLINDSTLKNSSTLDADWLIKALDIDGDGKLSSFEVRTAL